MGRFRFAWLVLVTAGLVACGGKKAPASIPPLPDASDDDSGAVDGGAATDGGATDGGAGTGGTGGDGGMLMGDVCTDHLSGASCAVKQVAAGLRTTCALLLDGTVKCWGTWGLERFGDETDSLGDAIPEVAFPVPIEEIALSETTITGRTADGRVYTVNPGVGGIEPHTDEWALAPSDEVVALAGSECALLSSGALVCNYSGPTLLEYPSLPSGVTFEHVMQTPFPARLTVRTSLNIESNACGLGSDHNAYCWGDNANHQLGFASPPSESNLSATLASVELMNDVVEVATGRDHACAVTDDDRTYCWGRGLNLQLGNGMRSGVVNAVDAVAVNIGPVEQLALGGDYSCAIVQGGDTLCWGSAAKGELGTGSRTHDGTLVPVDLGTGRRAVQISAGELHACAVLDDRSVKCWGDNSVGQLGIGNTETMGDEPGEMGDDLPRVLLGTSLVASGGPDVVVVSPTEATNPMTDEIHTGDTLEVTCDVQRSEESGPVNPAGVRIRLLTTSLSSTDIEVVAEPTTGNLYTGTLRGLSTLRTGAYVVECSATDLAAEPALGLARVTILQDSGPLLSILSPLPDTVVGQGAELVVRLTAAPGPFGDSGSEVVTVNAVIAGVSVTLVQDASEPTNYSASVDLLSSMFQPPPTGATTISVTATNERNVTATAGHTFVVDGTGPTIVVNGTQHDNGDIVHAVEEIYLTITDMPAGVDLTSVYMRIGTTIIRFDHTMGNIYRGVLDTQAFNRQVSQLPVEIHAFDRVGNETIEPRTFQLDNQPPIVSLDPPPIREFRRSGQNNQCSLPFDPLGSDSASDGDILPEGAEFRARVEDQTNGVEGSDPFGGGIVQIFAGVDPMAVDLLVLSDLTKPLLINTDQDPDCDEINDELASISGTSAFQTLSLRAITPKGTSTYETLGNSAVTEEPLWTNGCTSATTSPMPPALVCEPASSSSLLTRVIKAPLAGTFPAIWGLPGGAELACAGHYWDWQIPIPAGGPACVAVRAVDAVGNIGVSRPLRVCLERAGSSDCANDLSWQTHDCLAGEHNGTQESCTPPQDFAPGYRRAD